MNSVGVQNNPLLPWGGLTTHFKEIHIPFENLTTTDDGYQSVNLTKPIANATEFRILVRAHVIDNNGCFGKENNFTHKGN